MNPKAAKYVVFYLSLITIFTIPWRVSVQIDQFGSIGRLLGLIFGIFWIIYFIGHKRSIEFSWYLVSVYGFLLVFILGTAWSLNPADSFRSSIRFISIVLFITAIWDVYDSRGKIFAGLQTLILGGYVSTLGTIFVYYQNSTGYFRQAFYGYNVNYMAGTLVVLLPIAIILIKSDYFNGVVLRTLNILFLPFGTAAIIITGSRMGVVALIPLIGLATYEILSDQSFRNIAVVMVLPLILLERYLGIMTGPRIEYIQTLPHEIISGEIGGSRAQIWSAGLERGLESPLIGFGTRSFRYAVSAPNHPEISAHNSFLQIFVDLGFIGLTAYLSILLLVSRSAVNNTYSRGWITFLATFGLIAIANNFELNIILWTLFTFCVKLTMLK